MSVQENHSHSPAVATTGERQRTTLQNKANPVNARANTTVFADGFEALEVGNLLKGPGCFHLLNDLSDPAEQRHVRDDG